MNPRVLRRILLLIPAIAFEILLIIFLSDVVNPIALPISNLLHIFGLFCTLYIVTKEDEGVYKMIWLLIIMIFPVIGSLGYMLFGNKRTGKPLQKAVERSRRELPPMQFQAERLCADHKSTDPRAVQTLVHFERESGFPVYRSSSADYYALGDDMVHDMLEELEKAEKFIFIEYFIMENGVFWDSVTEILARKAAQGVDVRVIYDDLGSIATYSKYERRVLESKGIKCIAFNRVVFVLGTVNYRSHRKMMIIDGRVAFSGGINMADEYINQRKHPYGHWKDIGFRVTGGTVLNFMHMFAEFWNGFSDDKIDPALLSAPDGFSADSDGLALSYYDSPLDRFDVSNDLYIDLLSQAVDHVWFYTPYLLLGDRLLHALLCAARRGVDVRIIMPGIPDKKVVFRMAHAYYPALLEAGVRIFEYTPGFLHAKGCLSDDKFCAIGTVNLDYRSLFLHFENNTLFYRASIQDSMKADFLSTQAKCREIRSGDLKHGFIRWIIDGLLRLIAPLF